MTESLSLEDRPRLMALVFALRLTCLGLFILAASTGLVTLHLTEAREMEALCVLFSVFLLTVAGVLLFIRFSGHLHRVLVLTPLIGLVMPGWELQLLAFWIGGLFFLEAFRAQAWVFRSHQGFVISLGLWASAALALVIVPTNYLLWCGLPWSVSLGLAFGYGCWTWQEAIKQAMVSLDADQQPQGTDPKVQEN
jgi:hypothetical protein